MFMICSDMTAPLPIPDNPTEDPDAWEQAGLRRQAMVLEELSEAGLRLALSIEGRAAEAPVAEAPQIAMAFSRVARAVRLTALLHVKLIEAAQDARRRAAFVWSSDVERAAEDERRRDPAYGHKARVEAIVARVAKAGCDDEDDIDRIVQETAERLDDDDIYGDVLTRPLGELVALICRDLGLDPDWTSLAQEAWAQAEMRDNPTGSPFAPPSPLAGEASADLTPRTPVPGRSRRVPHSSLPPARGFHTREPCP
jgi:hypothetical protein